MTDSPSLNATTSIPELHHLRLVPHAIARDQVVAKRDLSSGSVILSTNALATVLIPIEKGSRCDACHILRTDAGSLRRCTGCSSYWYCSSECQNMDWKAHHRVICKSIREFLASTEYQSLALHDQLDSILLTHLVAEFYSGREGRREQNPGLCVMFTLMEGPVSRSAPPICPINKAVVPREHIQNLYARFANNNFVIHSHLFPYAHGIFPLASRLFNHSCAPNAAPKFIIHRARRVSMEVVSLASIRQDEEVCLPYLDPALIQSRRHILQTVYGFNCRCRSCLFLGDISELHEPTEALNTRAEAEEALRRYVFPDGLFHEQALRRVFDPEKDILPQTLHPVLRESYIADLSERFSRASHEGQAAAALESGITLLALYILIYPPNYPQIGLHLLEMAKTAWNATVAVSVQGGESEREMLRDCRAYLSPSHEILANFGAEGDRYGPLDEIVALQNLLIN